MCHACSTRAPRKIRHRLAGVSTGMALSVLPLLTLVVLPVLVHVRQEICLVV